MATVYTQAGEELVVDLLDETIVCPTDWYVAWGTGGGGAVKGDTTLTTEASESRVIGAATQPSADINQWVATITADGTKTIDEAGLLSASTSGTLLIRGDFTGIALTAGDKIEFTITLEQT